MAGLIGLSLSVLWSRMSRIPALFPWIARRPETPEPVAPTVPEEARSWRDETADGPEGDARRGAGEGARVVQQIELAPDGGMVTRFICTVETGHGELECELMRVMTSSPKANDVH